MATPRAGATGHVATDAPDRAGFVEQVTQALARAAGETQTATIVLGIEGLSAIGASLGREAAGEVVSALTPRLRATLGGADTLAPIDDDEFGVLCERVGERAYPASLTRRLVEAVTPLIVVDGNDVFLTANVGIALASAGAAATSLVDDASVAMRQARRRARRSVDARAGAGK